MLDYQYFNGLRQWWQTFRVFNNTNSLLQHVCHRFTTTGLRGLFLKEETKKLATIQTKGLLCSRHHLSYKLCCLTTIWWCEHSFIHKKTDSKLRSGKRFKFKSLASKPKFCQGYSSVAQCLSSKQKILSLIPNTKNLKIFSLLLYFKTILLT